MTRLSVVLIGAALVNAIAAADILPGGSQVVKVDLPTQVAAGEYEMESLAEGHKLAVKQIDSLKLEVDGQKVAGKYLKTQSGNGMDSVFVGEWAKGSTPVLTLHQTSADGYHAFYVLQASGKDTFSGTWMDNQDHHGPAKITLKKDAENK